MNPERKSAQEPPNIPSEAERIGALLNLERAAGGLDEQSANAAAKALGIKLKGRSKSS